MIKKLLFLILSIIVTHHLFAQKDSLIFKNGNYIVGEVKSLDKNILKVETDYSDDDFTIEWDGVKEIYTETYFLITLTNGSRYNGHLRSMESGKISILTEANQTVEVDLFDIVYMNDIDQGFWRQVYASVDFGLDLAKANNLQQLSMRSNLGYIAKRWQLDLAFNSLSSNQDNTDLIRRTDGGSTFKYFLPHDWYPLVATEFLTNTEQQIKLRSTGKIGIGKYIIHTNKTYWGFAGGINYNKEKFTDGSNADRNSLEGYLGTELNFFNVGDLNLLTTLVVYPGITESGRWRSDFKFDFKYDLPLDFYVKLGCTLNFDNQPAEGASKSDYVLHTGFGWEW